MVQNHLFPSLEDNLMVRPQDPLGKTMPVGRNPVHLKHEMIYSTSPSISASHPAAHMDSLEIMEPMCSPSLPPEPSNGTIYTSIGTPHQQPHTLHSFHQSYRGSLTSRVLDRISPEESSDLETFAERFKQRRIKLGVTQADVGRALVHLKLPGVGTLSQSTICRFESLTLSRNNMTALKPILQSWLEAAELHAKRRDDSSSPLLPTADTKKRRRTSIAALEKRHLEAYFAVQQRPSSERIASIAQKLDLKKSVVRVWFCNQRQKQKRMKYSATLQIPN
ncbi:POU domain, class 4, transcription factor 3-like [Uloborus diversus]|uniref:POU domain, class 4, transcription factor 3-like n=1 Tax=Uloborus diversus TaxID=327109 RepID=UPI002409D8E6|nr:POU domain, class 4, transcription factor 3-like [Uloborus diversus]